MQQPPNPNQPSQQPWQPPSQVLPPGQQWQQQPQPLQEQWQPQQPMPLQPEENRFDIPPQTPPQYQQSMTPGQQMYAPPMQPYPQQMPMYPPTYAPQVNNVVVVNVNKSNQSFLMRVLWYIFIGWWLGFFWLNVGYFFLLYCDWFTVRPYDAQPFALGAYLASSGSGRECECEYHH